MAPLSGARNTPKLGPGEVVLSMIDVPLKAGAKVYQGGVVCTDATGYGVRGATALGLTACGMLNSEQAASPVLDNTSGNSGDIVARVAQGVFRFANSAGGDAITQADVWQVAFIADDQTVAKTDGVGTRSPAGIIVAVETGGVYVSIAAQLSKLIETAGQSGSAPVQVGLTSGAISVATRSTTLAVSGTVAYTLANGTRLGQRKTIHADTAAATPHGVVTPATPSGFATLDFTTARGGAELEWTATGWRIVGISGTVVVA